MAEHEERDPSRILGDISMEYRTLRSHQDAYRTQLGASSTDDTRSPLSANDRADLQRQSTILFRTRVYLNDLIQKLSDTGRATDNQKTDLSQTMQDKDDIEQIYGTGLEFTEASIQDGACHRIAGWAILNLLYLHRRDDRTITNDTRTLLIGRARSAAKVITRVLDGTAPFVYGSDLPSSCNLAALAAGPSRPTLERIRADQTSCEDIPPTDRFAIPPCIEGPIHAMARDKRLLEPDPLRPAPASMQADTEFSVELAPAFDPRQTAAESQGAPQSGSHMPLPWDLSIHGSRGSLGHVGQNEADWSSMHPFGGLQSCSAQSGDPLSFFNESHYLVESTALDSSTCAQQQIPASTELGFPVESYDPYSEQRTM